MKTSLYSLKAGKRRREFHLEIPRPKRPVIVGYVDEVDWIAQWVRRYFLDGQATYVAILQDPIPEFVRPVDGVAWAMKRGTFTLKEAIRALYAYQRDAEKAGRGFITDLKKWRVALAQGLGLNEKAVHDAYISYLEEQRRKESEFLYGGRDGRETGYTSRSFR